MPAAREWWAKWVKTYVDIGITGFWNDMNEIAVWGSDVPKLVELDWEGQKTSYKEAKNVYGFLMSRSTYEGAKKYLGNERPFVLTRSGYSGLQRYTAIWTGDNQADDEHMFLGIRLLNGLGLCGIPFTGMDIGGFGGNPSQQLYTRWMQIGAFIPMYRGHTCFGTNRSEPWIFGEITEDIVRHYIGFRYRLLPYIYSCFYESGLDGMPVMRSLSIDYPFDPFIYDTRYQHQFLFGPFILVAPVKSTEELIKVYLPEGNWFDLFNDRHYEGKQAILCESPLNELPLFVKAGSIIPMQKLIESTMEKPGDTLFVHVYKGLVTHHFQYYEDDGYSYDYLDNDFYKRTITYKPVSNEIFFGNKEGNSMSRFKVINLLFHGFSPAEFETMKVNGTSQSPETKKIRMFTSHFGFVDFGPDDTKNVLQLSFKNRDKKITITW